MCARARSNGIAKGRENRNPRSVRTKSPGWVLAPSPGHSRAVMFTPLDGPAGHVLAPGVAGSPPGPGDARGARRAASEIKWSDARGTVSYSRGQDGVTSGSLRPQREARCEAAADAGRADGDRWGAGGGGAAPTRPDGLRRGRSFAEWRRAQDSVTSFTHCVVVSHSFLGPQLPLQRSNFLEFIN